MAERALVLQHEPAAPPETFGDWAAARGYEVEVLHARDPWAEPDLDSFALVVSLGSLAAAYDDSVPWLRRELELLTRAHTTGVPVLGICFGGQALARVLGAETRKADEPRAGWYQVDLSAPSDIPSGPWLFWHHDCFEVPPRAELLAGTTAGPAVFREARSLGVQFHPEVTPELVDSWIDEFGDDVDPERLDELHRVAHAEGERIRTRAWQLYDAFLAGASR
jgi:GMP synthase-like glutamine amidotransferase